MEKTRPTKAYYYDVLFDFSIMLLFSEKDVREATRRGERWLEPKETARRNQEAAVEEYLSLRYQFNTLKVWTTLSRPYRDKASGLLAAEMKGSFTQRIRFAEDEVAPADAGIDSDLNPDASILISMTAELRQYLEKRYAVNQAEVTADYESMLYFDSE